ncbi:cupin domain-containing protein [Rhizobium oryzicola]|uniref:Cupin domain-containing protein n=1 Tax=Rhizobium oryzicola TaxID=1232668 RepID=A0ABT8T0B3_9HYPH|nr:cupin domain-containing protein [Rhizobium oryzicola]MDO1584095.1 cupin domain-containing protein [Rhizobium oryzicola]
MTAEEIIRELGMQPHPEGGWYVETFRDELGGARGHSTAIYYLLEKGQRSHWHRVKDAAEAWHYYAGAPLALYRSDDGQRVETILLGSEVTKGQRPQAIIPANSWQAAESQGDYTLVGCTVAPGFQFSAFEMAQPDWQPGSL